ncbi:ATP-binding protein [Spirillospora sp. NPDC050679]
MRSDTASGEAWFPPPMRSRDIVRSWQVAAPDPGDACASESALQASEVAMRPGRHLISTVCAFPPAGAGIGIPVERPRSAAGGRAVPTGGRATGDHGVHPPTPAAAPVTIPIDASADQCAVLEAAAALGGMDVTAYVRAAVLKRLRLDQAAPTGRGLPRGLGQAVEPAQFTDATGMTSYRWTLAQQPRKVPAQARALVRAVLRARGLDDRDDVCVLLVSELVTNAVRHGGPGPVTLQLVFTESEVVCGVGDRSSEPPWRRRAGPGDEGGRGLVLLAALSSRWSWYPTAAGKTVWFAWPLSRARQAAPAGAPADGTAFPSSHSAFPAVG